VRLRRVRISILWMRNHDWSAIAFIRPRPRSGGASCGANGYGKWCGFFSVKRTLHGREAPKSDVYTRRSDARSRLSQRFSRNVEEMHGIEKAKDGKYELATKERFER
jgi:hypothetical protein